MNKNVLFFVTAALLMGSCMQNPKGEKVGTGDAHEVGQHQGVQHSVDIQSTKIEWEGTKPGGSHFGTITLQEGFLTIDNGTIVGGQMVMDMNNLIVKDIEDPKMNQMLVNHLKSPDFFAVDSFPISTFVITAVKPLEEPTLVEKIMVSHTVEGNLTLRGITRGINMPAQINIDNQTIEAFTPSFVLNRTHWKANYGSKSVFSNLIDNFIHDEFSLKIVLKAAI